MQSITNLINKNVCEIEPREDEYIKEKLLYCKKCNTQRSMFITNPMTKDLIQVRCLCECQVEERDNKEKQEKELKRMLEVEKLKNASLMGDRYKNVTFAATQTGHNPTFDIAYNRCKKYCEVSNKVFAEGMGIYLYGDKGTGKTHITACMANELMNQRYQVLFTNFFEISKMIRSTFNKIGESENDYINKLATIDFLFIDDLGTERVQNGENDLWLQEKMFDVLNKRYNNNKPTIFTSNNTLTELINDRGIMAKTVDRIAEMSSAIIKVEGESYRLKKRVSKDIPF